MICDLDKMGINRSGHGYIYIYIYIIGGILTHECDTKMSISTKEALGQEVVKFEVWARGSDLLVLPAGRKKTTLGPK